MAQDKEANMKHDSFDHFEHVPNNQQQESDAGTTHVDTLPIMAVQALHEQKTTRTMVFFAAWIAFAGWICNFDQGYQGAVLIMQSYGRAFGHCTQMPDPGTGAMVEVCALSATQQSLTGVQTLFYAAGAALAGVTGTWLGRRDNIRLACALCIISAAGMLGTGGSFLQYMVVKCIGGLGIGQLQAVAIVYGCECVAPRKRGLLLAIFNTGLSVGNASAAAVCAGSSNFAPTNDWQWKTPIICQIPLNLSLALGTFLFYESPRWLLIKGREDQARNSFAAFLHATPSSEIVSAQIQDVKSHLELERSIVATASWTEIYGRKNIRRTLTSTLVLVSMGITGIQFVGYYTALFLSGVGVHNPYLINVTIALCIFAGTIPGPLTPEYCGRRLSLLIGYMCMGSFMLIFSSVSTGLGADNSVAKNVVVVFLCLWAFTFGAFIGPNVWLSSAEMHSVSLRTYGQASTTAVFNIFNFGATFWTPYMLNPAYGNMGVNVGYFYFGVTFVITLLIFWFVPETARLTLEQVDDYFATARPAWKTSLPGNKQLATAVPLEVVVRE
ncbi:uncharacterized protein Z519_05931 [Cladophialophora bantiana CBS 173.52]|uniref:Major facilitator superfamily (MFS) profile domain-containing protein n=1 Tax=Cladophialophora bantiana (strain ATCC 10958 / CBS 173.52 / CDC B-1940 / NIH 8579) TaxID=1442370 RepID=A0A0D2ETV9_CLAB1|nr:uncharacterized protein Z519_05931 [Cladophialophora bantiana CBS 173.52]KIW93326.1 hypothetical protein Z519_05931 [Cladophialophora bantiana CBS 173.52]